MRCFEKILYNEYLLNCPKINQDKNNENRKHILNGGNRQKKRKYSQEKLPKATKEE